MSRFLVIPHSDSPIHVSAAADSSERGAQRDNPTVIVLMELCYGDLHSDTEVEMKSLDQWKWTDDDAGVKNTCLSPLKGPSTQNVEFCSIMGQSLSLIL